MKHNGELRIYTECDNILKQTNIETIFCTWVLTSWISISEDLEDLSMIGHLKIGKWRWKALEINGEKPCIQGLSGNLIS
jgi:hypothetical protein